jgi:hypothetical protein
LGGSIQGWFRRALLASEVRELSQESRLSLFAAFGELREYLAGGAPTSFCLVEPTEF